MLKRLSPLDMFLAMFILMYYGRLSVVLFIPQFAIDNGISAPFMSLHFAMLSVGCALSNILAIILLRHVSPKKMFLFIGVVSAAYELLLYFFPSPETVVFAGLLIGIAAGMFWSLAFLVICELIDAYQLSTTDAFSRYTVVSTVMAALTPLAAGVIVHQSGYGAWLISALGFLIVSSALIAFLKDPVYGKTYGQYPIKEDLKKVLGNKRSMITFLLTMLFMTLTVSTWASISRVFFANIGIRNVWLGLLSILVSVITIVVFWFLARRRVASRRVIATIGIVIFGIEMLLLAFVNDPLIVFVLEGIVGTTGIAAVCFATQDILKNTFRERTYIGRPAFAFGMYVANAVWFAVIGYMISYFGGYEAVGSLLGVTVSQFGLRVFFLVMAALAAAWAITMWKYDRQMVGESPARETLNRRTINRSDAQEN